MRLLILKTYDGEKYKDKGQGLQFSRSLIKPISDIWNSYICRLRQRIINEEDFLRIEPWAYSMKGVFAEGIKNLLDDTQSHVMWSGNVILKNVNLSIGTIRMAFQEIKAHSY